MNHSLGDTAATEPRGVHAPRSHRLRFELAFTAGALALGLFVLPALIYGVGVALLGPYGTEGSAGGWGTFYGDFFADLATPVARAWAIAFGPLILITLLRLVFLGARQTSAETPLVADSPRPGSSSGTPRHAPGDAGSGRARRTPRLSPAFDASENAAPAPPTPPAATPAITADPRPGTASRTRDVRPAQRPGRIEPRVGSD